jgi:hypothetical protein
MENKKMSFQMFASKTMAILLVAFFNSVFAWFECKAPSKKERSELDDYYRNLYVYERDEFLASCDDTLSVKEQEVHPRGCGIICGDSPVDVYPDGTVLKTERISINTNYYEGMKKIHKTITCKDFRETIVAVYDKKDSLWFFKHYKWKGKMLIRAIDGDIVRNIIPGKTCCDFIIIEPSGDSISFHLDPKKNLDDSIKIRNENQFSDYMLGHPLIQKFKVKAGKYDAIIYHWQLYCKYYYETEELIRGNNRLDIEDEQEIVVKDDYEPPYKYYAIISICIITASIVAVRKKWRIKK